MWGLIIKGITLFFSNLMIVLFGEPMVRWIFFKFMNWFVNITPTDIDNRILSKIEEEYKKKHGE